jgi:OHCU decarboxylase
MLNPVLDGWNKAEEAAASNAILACCGASRWAREMAAARPIANVAALSEAADHIWARMAESDWLEAFACHPRIGERKVSIVSGQSAAWSKEEQSAANAAAANVLHELAEGNVTYEQRFGFTYIVCATGKSSEEMLSILQRRLLNDRRTELIEAAEQQRQIMQIRLGKWLLS